MGALALAALVSCSDEEDILPQQQEKIVSYLTRSHTPTLLSEQDAAQSLDNDPPYYSTFGNTTYRYIADVYDEERLTRPEVSEGSRVELAFSLYDFTAYPTPKPNESLYSNDTTIPATGWSATSTECRFGTSSGSSCRSGRRCRSAAGRRSAGCRRRSSVAAKRMSWNST